MIGKSAVVTGAAGFLGSHTVERLLAEGYAVTAIDLQDAPIDDSLNSVLNDSKLTVVLKNITEIPVEDSVFKNQDFFFHCAGCANPKAEACYLIEANIGSMCAALDIAKLNQFKKFIYPSSASVYGTAQWPTREDHQLAPNSPYALSKLMGEELARNWRQWYGVPSIGFRIFNGYGIRDTNSVIVSKFLKNLIEGKPLTLIGGGEQKRDFIHVNDIVDAFLKGANSSVNFDVFNLATGQPSTILDVAKLIGEDIVFTSPLPGEPEVICADISRIKNDLSWKPLISLEEGIAELKKICLAEKDSDNIFSPT